MGYWKSKVLPKIKKVFDKNGNKKAAAEACKAFDDSKEEYSKEFEDKKTELQPKVIEIYESSSTEIKTLVKEPKDSELKKHSAGVQKFFDELLKIEFPGSKPICEASSKFGAASIQGPIFFVFEKISTFIVTEEVPAAQTSETLATEVKEREIAIEEEKKEEAAPPPPPPPAVPVEKTEVEAPPPPKEATTEEPPTQPKEATTAEPPAAAEPPKP